jgi:pilus assembly protein CpaB
MRVDVLVSGVPPNAPPAVGTITKTVLQDIQVLSAGTDIQKDAEGKPQQVQVVNLLVTPDQAQTLSLATGQLKVQLVLRNPLDTKVAQISNTAMDQMFGDSSAPRHGGGVRARRVEPRLFTIEVINGTKTSVEKFSSPEAKQ